MRPDLERGVSVEKSGFVVAGADGEPIRADLWIDAGPRPRPVVVIAHGFKGFKDWGAWPEIASRLAREGFASITFNFSHGGLGEDPERYDRLDLFQKDTWSKQLVDLRRLLAAVRERRVPRGESLDPERIGLVGHSRGGGVAILVASGERGVRAVVGLAAVAETDRFPEGARAQAERDGFFPILNTRTGQSMPVGKEFFDDLASNAERLSIRRAASRMTLPLLLVHGTSDEVVPFAEAEAIAGAAPAGLADVIAIEGAGHTFGVVHPYRGSTSHLEEAFVAMRRFLRRHLLPECTARSA